MIKKIIILLFISSSLLAHHPGNKVEAISPYPKISLNIEKDSMDGYNIFFVLNNFKITPENVGKENIDNEGYLQIYVNDIKISRVYSNWTHVPSRFFSLKRIPQKIIPELRFILLLFIVPIILLYLIGSF